MALYTILQNSAIVNIKDYSKLPAVSLPPTQLFLILHPHTVGCLLPLQPGSPVGR